MSGKEFTQFPLFSFTVNILVDTVKFLGTGYFPCNIFRGGCVSQYNFLVCLGVWKI